MRSGLGEEGFDCGVDWWGIGKSYWFEGFGISIYGIGWIFWENRIGLRNLGFFVI